MREKAPYKGRKLPSKDRNNPVKSGDNSASACSNLVNSGGDDATGREYYSSLSEEAPSEEGDCLSVMASNASNYHCQNLTDKKEADILSLLKARSNISKRNSQSNKDSGKPSKRKRCSQAGQPSSDLDLEIEEEILLEYDKSHITNNDEGPEILKALAERVDRYWSDEALNFGTVKTIVEEYKYPKNATKFIIPALNEEIKEAVHPALLRIDQKYVAMQKTLIHATSAMACMANSILSADRKGHMQDSKALIKTSLDVITILGHSHNEINKRRRETISSGLNKESRQSCKKTIENSHKLFGEDLSKTLKEMKEVKKVANEISNQRSSYAQKRGYFKQRNYDKTASHWRNQHQQPTRGRGKNFFRRGRKPNLRGKSSN